jgi:hypothetical protein
LTTVQTHEDFLLGAFAELIDNASEAMASSLKIDVDFEGTGALYFLDDGIGMDRSTVDSLMTKAHDALKIGVNPKLRYGGLHRYSLLSEAPKP